MILQWVINPGLAFNELFLGQRLPKVTLVEKHSDKPLVERTYVPCPHCTAMHDGRLWGKGNAFGHWFGYVCPACGENIPCLWNVISLLLLLIAFPIWYLPARLLRPRWIEFEKKRLKRSRNRPVIQAKNINWILRGTLAFGGIMWLAVSVTPLIVRLVQGRESSIAAVWIQLPIWLLAGLIWGLFMHIWMNKRGKRTDGAVD